MGEVDEDGLDELWDEIREASAFSHLQTQGIRLVPGYGASRPLAMVVGEAPGAQENAHGRPFCGPSGRVLHQLMESAGLYADPKTDLEGFRRTYQANIWLTNAIKFRPPGNRTPTFGEQAAARPYLLREWELIGKPRLIIAVGSVAADTIAAHPVRMMRGELYPMRNGKTWICYQYHPAYGLRNPNARPTMERHWEQMGEMIDEMREELWWR